METRARPSNKPARSAHPNLPLLVGGLALRPTELQKRPDAERLTDLYQMLSNAEYWLSFDVASFEPLLTMCPSPLRELGVAVSLRYCERIDGHLGVEALQRAKEELLEALTEDLKEGVQAGLTTLERAVRTRERSEEYRKQGFQRYNKNQGLSVHALRAAGRSVIEIQGVGTKEQPARIQLGEPLLIKSTDDRGRPLAAAEVESRIAAPVLIKEEQEPGHRTIIFTIPGEYRLRVPGRATGDRKVVAH